MYFKWGTKFLIRLVMNIKNLKLKEGNRFISPNTLVSMVMIMVLFILFSDYAYGQNVIHVSALNGSSMKNNGEFDFERAKSLIYKRNSAAYFQDGQTKYYGETQPVMLFVDVNQLQAISGQLDKLLRVEMVKINLNGGNVRSINKNVLYELPLLKYVYLVCDRCVEAEMTNFLPPQDGEIRNILVIYNSEIKE